LFTAVTALVEGKVKRLSCISNARRSFVPAPEVTGHPAPLISHDPDRFFLDFIDYRRRLFEFFASRNVVVDPAFAKAVTQAHLLYLVNTLGDGSWVRELITREFAKKFVSATDYQRPGGAVNRRVRRYRSWVLELMKRGTLSRRYGSWLRDLIVRGTLTRRLRFIPNGVEFHLSETTRKMIPPDIAIDLSNYCNVISDAGQAAL
jgi:hypothetical protein